MAAGHRKQLTVESSKRAEVIDLTERVGAVVEQSGLKSGLCHLYVPHTTAGIFINENADPDVMDDLLTALDRLVPWANGYKHAEGNAAAHIKSSLVGTSQTLAFHEGRLQLGRWQGVYFAEFDGPRERQLRITLLA
jgi:secondary thiamine-phosphate synthase enzyme